MRLSLAILMIVSFSFVQCSICSVCFEKKRQTTQCCTCETKIKIILFNSILLYGDVLVCVYAVCTERERNRLIISIALNKLSQSRAVCACILLHSKRWETVLFQRCTLKPNRMQLVAYLLLLLFTSGFLGQGKTSRKYSRLPSGTSSQTLQISRRNIFIWPPPNACLSFSLTRIRDAQMEDVCEWIFTSFRFSFTGD